MDGHGAERYLPDGVHLRTHATRRSPRLARRTARHGLARLGRCGSGTWHGRADDLGLLVSRDVGSGRHDGRRILHGGRWTHGGGGGRVHDGLRGLPRRRDGGLRDARRDYPRCDDSRCRGTAGAGRDGPAAARHGLYDDRIHGMRRLVRSRGRRNDHRSYRRRRGVRTRRRDDHAGCRGAARRGRGRRHDVQIAPDDLVRFANVRRGATGRLHGRRRDDPHVRVRLVRRGYGRRGLRRRRRGLRYRRRGALRCGHGLGRRGRRSRSAVRWDAVHGRVRVVVRGRRGRGTTGVPASTASRHREQSAEAERRCTKSGGHTGAMRWNVGGMGGHGSSRLYGRRRRRIPCVRRRPARAKGPGNTAEIEHPRAGRIFRHAKRCLG